MSRQVFSPPPPSRDWIRPALGALGITTAVFLVLPLTQIVSSGAGRQLSVTEIGAAQPPPPPPPTLEEPPPPEPPPPPPPPPDVSDPVQQLSLSALDLDLGLAGGSGFLGGGFNPFAAAAEELSQSDIFDASDLDSPPRAISQAQPRTRGLKRVSGVVSVLFIVDENGRVVDPRIESSHDPSFEEPVLNAVRRWRFAAGKKDGETVKTFVRQTIPFRFR